MKNQILIFSSLSILLLSACRRNNDDTVVPDKETESVEYYALGNNITSENEYISELAISGELEMRNESIETTLLSTCAQVTNDTANNIVTIDFGSVNCLCNDGRYRRGQIIVNYNLPIWQAGHSRTITFNNYYRNNNKIEGTKTVQYLGQDSITNYPTWTIDVQNMTVTKANGQSFNWSSQRTRQMVAGYNTLTRIDNVFHISGNTNGTRLNGKTYTATITSPLVIKNNCNWIVEGKVNITPLGIATRTLDFGNGICDDQATVSANGNTYNITLN